VRNEVTRILMNVKVQSAEQVSSAAEQLEAQAEHLSNVTYTAPTETGEAETGEAETTADRGLLGGPAAEAAALPRVGRNDPCPCGSGKKYKQCHGKLS
jgi:preprotein translocase subunit SecA